MRNPQSIAIQIKEVVPDKYKPVLDKLIYDFSYHAPEMRTYDFGVLSLSLYEQRILTDYLTEEWQFKVASLISDQPIEAIRTYEKEKAYERDNKK